MLLRHGQSFGNTKEECYGHLDYNLTDLGVRQAQKIQKKFIGKNDQFTSLNSSVLIRAMETANIILGLGLDLGASSKTELYNSLGYEAQTEEYEKHVNRDANFNEFNFGPLEGADFSNMTFEEHCLIFKM